MRLKSGSRWLLALTLTSAVAGCQQAPGSGTTQQLPDPRPFGGITGFSASEAAVLHHAEEVAVHTCMRRRGFDYHEVPSVADSRVSATNPYGLLDARRAATDGYGMTSELLQADGQVNSDPNTKLLAAMTTRRRAQWRAALIGTPSHQRRSVIPGLGETVYQTDGCTFMARQQAYGQGWDRLYDTFEGLTNLVVEHAERSPRYADAINSWSRCVKKIGYDFSGLQDPRQLIQDRLDTASRNHGDLYQVGELELRIATQDYTCEQQVNLHYTVQAVQSEIEKTLLRGHENELRQLRQLRAKVIQSSHTRAVDQRSGGER